LTTVTPSANSGKGTSSQCTPHSPPEGNGMANKIEIRPLDKKETTSESGGNGGA
jgi:hypothetical protein